jgi:general transcription factor 3C polypeptide 5 (transcription factor C subunit 1)
VQDLRKFKLDPSRGPKENEELIPGPTLSDKALPFNWGYHQNSTIKVTTDDNTGEQMLINNSAVSKVHTFYVTHDCETVPTGPPSLPPPEPMITAILTELQQLLDERPIWTRRAILNRLSNDNPALYLLKPAIQYLAYQFRGGPWRDAIVKYGVDPRKDPKYRIYQTLFFKVVDERLSVRQPGDPWHDIRSEYTRRAQRDDTNISSHIFDGQSISLDGKIWQVCDITDPLLRKLLDTETLRTECDDRDGWFCNGTMAKVKAVMRTKITAIQLGRDVAEEDFAKTLEIPDHVKDKEWFHAKMPVLRVPEELLPGEAAQGEQQMSGGMVGLKVKHGSAWRKRRLREIKKRKLVLGLLDENDELLNTRRGRLTARKLMGQYGVTVDAPQDIVPSISGDPRVDEAMRHFPSIEGYEMQAADEDGMGLNAEDGDDDLVGDLSDEDDGDDEQGESGDEDDDDEDSGLLNRDDMDRLQRAEGYQDSMDEVLEEEGGYNNDLGDGDYDDDLVDNHDVRRVM